MTSCCVWHSKLVGLPCPLLFGNSQFSDIDGSSTPLCFACSGSFAFHLCQNLLFCSPKPAPISSSLYPLTELPISRLQPFQTLPLHPLFVSPVWPHCISLSMAPFLTLAPFSSSFPILIFSWGIYRMQYWQIAPCALPHVRLPSSALLSRLSVLSRSAQVLVKAWDAELENKIYFSFFANLTC